MSTSHVARHVCDSDVKRVLTHDNSTTQGIEIDRGLLKLAVSSRSCVSQWLTMISNSTYQAEDYRQQRLGKQMAPSSSILGGHYIRTNFLAKHLRSIH